MRPAHGGSLALHARVAPQFDRGALGGESLVTAALNSRLDTLESRAGVFGGHRFLFVVGFEVLVAPDRLRAERPTHAGVTLFALAALDERFRFLGVGHWRSDEDPWAIPEVDFATSRAWDMGRTASRALPHGALARAQAVGGGLFGLPEAERALARGDLRAHVLGRAPCGGLRVAVGQGERTMSFVDLGWVAVAAEDVAARDGVLDEGRVNRLRYLEGTPKGSTRWIDTGWAIEAWTKGAPLASAASLGGAALKPRRVDGSDVEATFRVERVDGAVTVVIESRGGTRGSGDEVNTEYTEGLRLVLERLHAASLSLADAALDTQTISALTHEERRLDLGAPWPIALDDAADVQQRRSRA